MKISFSPGVLLLFPVLLLKGGMLFPAALLAAALHESGHLLMGRWLGIRFSRMEFDLLGARLYPTRLPSYREEFFLVIAGPPFRPGLAGICVFEIFFLQQSFLCPFQFASVSRFGRRAGALCRALFLFPARRRGPYLGGHHLSHAAFSFFAPIRAKFFALSFFGVAVCAFFSQLKRGAAPLFIFV